MGGGDSISHLPSLGDLDDQTGEPPDSGPAHQRLVESILANPKGEIA